MECGGGASREPDETRQMVACELEAAEALAGLARSSSSLGGAGELRRQLATEAVVTTSAQVEVGGLDRPVAAEQVCDYATTTVTSPEKTERNVENIPSKLCSTSCQPNPMAKFKRKLTEAEREERKLRRILANRESARQTIRRRQAMYLELTRKAADVLEENENLKKEKELAVEEYNYLKNRNEFLKAQFAEIKRAEGGETEEEPKTSEAENSCSATTSTPFFLHNQPSIVPCFWPSVLPTSDVFPFHCASHSHNTSSSQFLMPEGDTPCSHQGREHSTGSARPGTPLFLVPVPWLLPLLTHSGTLHSHSGTSDRTNTHQCSKGSCSETRLHEDNNQLSSDQNMKAKASNPTRTMSRDSVHIAGLTISPDSGGQYTACQATGSIVVPGLFSPVRPLETLEPLRSSQVDETADANVVSTPESTRHGLLQKNQKPIICPHKKPEDVYAATAARRRRKELMKLKNVHCHDVRTHY